MGRAGRNGSNACRLAQGLGVAAVLLVLSLTAAPARAQGYEAALRGGVVARDVALETHARQDWQRAFDSFQQAVDQSPTTEARFELAEAAAQLGLVDVAYEEYELVIAAGVSGKAEDRARTFLEAHAGEIAWVEFEGPAGTVVYVNRRRRAVLPLSHALVVPAGRVELRFLPADDSPWEESLDVVARGLIRLEPKRPRDPEPVAEASWFSRPGPIALVAVTGVSLVSGLLFYKQWTKNQNDADRARSQILVALESNVERGVLAPSAVPCGGELAFDPRVTPSTTAYLTGAFHNACDKFSDRSDSARRFRTLSLATLGVGAAAMVTGVIWYLADSSSGSTDPHDSGTSSPRSPNFFPIVSADTRGLGLSVEF
jgi:hypothetical protein